MLRIIAVAALAILVEFRLYVDFAGIFSDTLSQRLVDFFVGWQQLGLFLGKETRQDVCLSRGLLRWYSWGKPMAELAAVIVGISHNIVSLFNPVPCRYFVILTTLIARPVYTRDPHSLFIAPADGLVLSGTRPSACAMASTKLHMYV